MPKESVGTLKQFFCMGCCELFLSGIESGFPECPRCHSKWTKFVKMIKVSENGAGYTVDCLLVEKKKSD
jgi:hypothetical protein